MKNTNRIIITILSLLLVFQCAAIAENERFSVRNGIMFGMSKDEVIEIEKSNDLELFDEWPSLADEKQTTLVYKPDSVAGIASGSIYYTIYDGSLAEIQYSWGIDWSKHRDNSSLDPTKADEAEMTFTEYYRTLDSILLDKYELIGYMENSKIFKYIEIEGLDFSIINSDSGDYKILGFSQYIGKDGDNYIVVKIECYRHDFRLPYSFSSEPESISFSLHVNYIPLSQEAYNNLVDKAEDIQKQRDTDL